MAASDFRYDAYLQRAHWHKGKRKGAGKSPPASSDQLNEGKPVLIHHYLPEPFQQRPQRFFFTYSFPLTAKQMREGHGELLFVGPSSQTSAWLGMHGQSFYETHPLRTTSLPSDFRALIDPVTVPFSSEGSVQREKDTLVYRIGERDFFLMSLAPLRASDAVLCQGT